MTNRSESRAKGPTRDDFKAPCIPAIGLPSPRPLIWHRVPDQHVWRKGGLFFLCAYQYEMVSAFTQFLKERHIKGKGELSIQFELESL